MQRSATKRMREVEGEQVSNGARTARALSSPRATSNRAPPVARALLTARRAPTPAIDGRGRAAAAVTADAHRRERRRGEHHDRDDGRDDEQ